MMPSENNSYFTRFSFNYNAMQSPETVYQCLILQSTCSFHSWTSLSLELVFIPKVIKYILLTLQHLTCWQCSTIIIFLSAAYVKLQRHSLKVMIWVWMQRLWSIVVSIAFLFSGYLRMHFVQKWPVFIRCIRWTIVVFCALYESHFDSVSWINLTNCCWGSH